MAFTFQSEKPADKDAFPGESHQRIAQAMARVIEENDDIRIIGLDGEFGSGKSSIINMFGNILKNKNPAYKTWTFDCEQNYQGSIKSNFLELFSADILDHTKNHKSKKEKIEEIRDIALGRRLDYTKETKSRVSAWAIVFFIAVLFSSSAIREFVGIITGKSNLSGLPYYLILAISISPIAILMLAQLHNAIRKEKAFTLWGIIKGNSVDEIKERIDIGKEVSTVELKKSLGKILEHAENTKYIIIIDNLDRLPREELRSVWSDLEIFTSAANESSFKIVVPFSSIKVAMHLSELSPGDSDENAYDAKDFISKKFPVVFNAPPIITSGWKSHFSKLWTEAFGLEHANEANLCATLIHRHAPTPQKIVTPRFQKKFFNDLQTTLLTSEQSTNRLAISAYILICRYNNISLQQLLSEHPDKSGHIASDDKKADKIQSIENEIQLTRSMLTAQSGNELKSGWPSTILQVHYQTTYEIAISELIETPIQTAIESANGEQLASLIHTFGFNDALRKILATQTHNITLIIKSIASTIEKIDSEEKSKELIDILNSHYQGISIVPDPSSEDELYFKGLDYLTSKGLRIAPFSKVVDTAYNTIKIDINLKGEAITEVTPNSFIRYDNYLSALKLKASTITASAGDVFVSKIVPIQKFKVLSLRDFKFTPDGYADAIKNILSNEYIVFDKTPIDYDSVLSATLALLRDRRIGGDEPYKNNTFYLNKSETASFVTLLSNEHSDPSIWLGLLLSSPLDSTAITTVLTNAKGTEDLTCKTIAIILLLKHGNFSAINSITDAMTALEENEDLAYVLAKATCNYDQIFNGLNSNINSFCTKTLIRAYRSNDIASITVRKPFEEYELFLDSTTKAGLSKTETFNLLEQYKTLIVKGVIPIKGLPDKLIKDALSLIETHESGQLIVNHYLESDLSIESWKEIINDPDKNIDIVISHIQAQSQKLSKAAPLRDAIVQTLGSAESFEGENRFAFERCIELSQLLSVRVLNNFSSDLRRLALDSNLPTSYRCELLNSFGNHISVFTPESISEYEALSRFIELALSGTASEKIATFIETHTKDIHQYAIPDQYVAAFAHQNEDLEKFLPKFHSELKTKRAFKAERKRILKELREEMKAAAKNQQSLDERPTLQSREKEAPEVQSSPGDDQ